MSTSNPQPSRWATPTAPNAPGHVPPTAPTSPHESAFDATAAFATTRTAAPPTVVVGATELAAAIAESPPPIPPSIPHFVGPEVPPSRSRRNKAVGVSVVAFLLLGGAAGGSLVLRNRNQPTLQTASGTAAMASPSNSVGAGGASGQTAPGVSAPIAPVGTVGTVGTVATDSDGSGDAAGEDGSTATPSTAPPPTTAPSAPTSAPPKPPTNPTPTNPPAPAPTTPPTTAAPMAKVTSVNAPAVWSCGSEAPHGPPSTQLTISWTSTNATKVTLGIDSPSGVYADDLPASGSLVVPAPCAGDTQTYYITAYGPNGSKDTMSVTTEGRA